MTCSFFVHSSPSQNKTFICLRQTKQVSIVDRNYQAKLVDKVGMSTGFVARTIRLTSKRYFSMSAFPVQAAITENLTKTFSPSHLEVINESHKHSVPKNSETHFKVVVVSSEFEEVKTPIQRHRLVNTCLADQLEGPVHALSIVAKTPAQWRKMMDAGESVGPSPTCRGGDGSLPSR